MTTLTSPPPPAAPAAAARELFAGPLRFCLVAGVLGLGACGVGAFLDPAQFFFSYLVGFLFWTGLSLGCLCVLMIHLLTGGGWGYMVRRFLEAAATVLPLMAVLFAPVYLGVHRLYPWAQPEVVRQMEALAKRHAYLNVPMFTVRSVLSFALFIGAAYFLSRGSRAQDRTADPAPTRRLRAFSGPALLVFVLVASLATVDWIMVLEPVFYSTVFPAQVIIGWILSTFAFCTVMLAYVHEHAPWKGVVRTEHFHSLGNFLLAFVMMWAYLAVSQLIIIWSGNLPKEIGWYLHRVADGWKWVAIFLGLFHFALPFLLLLSREAKESVRRLTRLALFIFCVHAVEVFWQVEPSRHPVHFSLSWMDPAALAGVGGLWLAMFCWRMQQGPLIPRNDPRMERALIHGH